MLNYFCIVQKIERWDWQPVESPTADCELSLILRLRESQEKTERLGLCTKWWSMVILYSFFPDTRVC